MMEKERQSGCLAGVRDLTHRKMRSFQLDAHGECLQKENKTAVLLKNSKSTIDLPRQALQSKTNRKFTTSANLQDRQTRTRLFTAVYSHKISKLITSNTVQQRERYMRKLNQALTDDAFRAVGYEFDHTYVRFLAEILLYGQVSVLVLDNNPLGDEGVTKLAPIIKKLPLVELSLVSVSMGNSGASTLFTALREVPTLCKLNISTGQPINKNKLTADGAQPLRLLLSTPTCIIDSLHLDHLQLGSEGARVAFQGITNNSLQCLSLSKNDIGTKHIGTVIQSLSKVPLMRLDLSKNSLGDAGMKSLTDVLGIFYSKNSMSMNLSYLNISTNGITSQGFQYFCREMSGNRTLQTLILDQNPLGDGDRFFNIKYYLSKNWGLKKLSLINISPCEKDLRFVCEGMQGNRSLQHLILSKNEVDCDLLSLILFMLSKNKALRRLTLNNCKISDNYLLRNEYLVGNAFSAIEEIDLENNYINLKGAAVLKRMATANQNILKLSLAKNCMPETSIDEINQILKENESKRPFEHELNYFHSLSDLYEEKKRALKIEVEDIRKQEEKLQTHLLAGQIEHQLTIQQKLKKRIAREQNCIRNYEGSMPGMQLEEESDSDGGCFLTINIKK